MLPIQSASSAAGVNGSSALTANQKIDVCRGLFAFLVVIAHSHEVAWTMHPGVADRVGWVYRQVFTPVVGLGIYWVMGFFVISGYCIQLSVHRLTERGSFPLGTYLVARLTRILPLYYGALLFTVAVECGIQLDRPPNWLNGLNVQTFLCQVLLIQNLTETFGSYAASWSITNEAFYYVIYGLLVAALIPMRRSPAVIGLAICIGVSASLGIPYRLGFKSPVMLRTGMLFGLGTNWFLGALVAEHRARLSRNHLVQSIARWWPLILGLTIGLWCTDRVGLECVWIGTGFAFTLMIIRFLGREQERASRDPVPGPPTRSRPLIAALGLASYPTYLFHGPIIMLVGSIMIQQRLTVDWRWTWAILSSAGISSGILLGYLIEKPIMSWRADFLRRMSSPQSPRMGGSGKVRVAGAHQ